MCMCWRDVLCSKGSHAADLNDPDNMVMLGSFLLHLTSMFVYTQTCIPVEGRSKAWLVCLYPVPWTHSRDLSGFMDTCSQA